MDLSAILPPDLEGHPLDPDFLVRSDRLTDPIVVTVNAWTFARIEPAVLRFD